ncbi:MAG: helix-turn-helix transcriptional regulator [Senegalia sp. (in: firmicutes)]|uniref:helix-turn-helix transcriptional regulator n=2 Tax=Senegalia sp. (in: firmicutes) TaxID=1924098 RepID=UPI003F9B85D8
MIKINESRILMLDLLDVLKIYSDKNYPLTQQNIIEILEKKYGYTKVRRQTIQSNLERMIDYYELGDKVIRLAAEDNYYDNNIDITDETKRRITNVYYQHKLSDPELILIIDSILFSKQIPIEEKRNLIEKLEGLSSKHFNSKMSNIYSMSNSNNKGKKLKDKTLFDNIREIDKAITESKKISFNYLTYNLVGNKISLETRKDYQREERKYTINPYYMVASNGRYYLICNNDSFDDVSIFRVDRIINIKITNKRRKLKKEVEGLGENFNLNDYMQENIYMFGGGSEYVKLSLKKEFLNEFIDWFKLEDINVQAKKDDQIIVRVKSNRMAMRRWALRYALYVRVLSPKNLVNEIKEDLKNAIKNYDIE